MSRFSLPAVAALCAVLSSCTLSESDEDGASIFPPDVIEAHAAWAWHETAVVIDVRPEAAYAKAHLPGAVRVDEAEWRRLSFTEGSGPEAEPAWYERIGALGIDGRTPVLVYDGGEMKRAARIWFLLRHFGSPASVVNGGWPLLVAARPGDLLEREATRPQPVRFDPAASAAHGFEVGFFGREQLKAAIAAEEVQVLDVRTEDEYRGIDLRKNARGGALPGARNLPHERLLDGRGRLKEPAELAALLREAGFVPGEPIVSHCQSGGRSSLGSLAAARAGFGPVYHYYGGFGDWAADASCPLERP